MSEKEKEIQLVDEEATLEVAELSEEEQNELDEKMKTEESEENMEMDSEDEDEESEEEMDESVNTIITKIREWKSAKQEKDVVTEEETVAEEKEINVDLSDDMSALVSGENLSEDFKEKAQTIFESAVQSKVKEIRKELTEQFSAELDEKIKAIEESQEAELKSSVDFVVESVNNYLDYTVAEWMEENKLAVETGIRTEISEEFIDGLKNLFQEHYIEVPEEKTDMVDDLVAKVEELKEAMNSIEEKNMSLLEENRQYKKQEILDKMSSDLSLSQREKLASLVEDVHYISEEQFEKKVNIIKESYFNKKDSAKPKSSKMISEELETLGENVDTSKDESVRKPVSKMDIYAQAIKMASNK